MSYCLPAEESKKLLAGIADGSFSPEKYAEQGSTEARRAYVGKFVSEAEVQQVNTLMESKMLLKDWQRGMVTAVKNLTGMSEVAKRDLIARIEKMKELLNPADEKSFYADITAQKLGAKVTVEQANQLAAQSKAVTEAKTKAQDILSKKGKDLKNWTKEERLVGTEYGTRLALMKDYIDTLKLPETSISRDLLDATKSPTKLANIFKSLVASFDDSFFLNQGKFALFDPMTTGKWFSAFGKSFGDIKKSLLGGDPMIGIRGEIYGRPNSLDGTYERMKLAIGIHTEESIPTTIGEKIPLIGRFFKASNSAYNGAALRLRADIADMKVAQAERNGINLKDKVEAESLGHIVNSFTGRGDFQTAQSGILSAESVNAYVFSARLAQSNWDVMTSHIFSDKVTAYGKKQAAYSLLRIIGTASLVFALSEILNPGSTELDPRATNFGKIRIGKTWYPTPLTFAGFPNLIARTLIPTTHNGKWGLWMKSGTGKWSNLLGGKYGQVTANDIFTGFFENKAAPVARALLDTWNGKDFNGNKSTLTNVGKNLVTPISAGNIMQVSQNPAEEYKLFNYFMQVIGSNPSTPK